MDSHSFVVPETAYIPVLDIIVRLGVTTYRPSTKRSPVDRSVRHNRPARLESKPAKLKLKLVLCVGRFIRAQTDAM